MKIRSSLSANPAKLLYVRELPVVEIIHGAENVVFAEYVLGFSSV